MVEDCFEQKSLGSVKGAGAFFHVLNDNLLAEEKRCDSRLGRLLITPGLTRVCRCFESYQTYIDLCDYGVTLTMGFI